MNDLPIICPKCGEMGVQIEVIQTGGWVTHFCRTCAESWPTTVVMPKSVTGTLNGVTRP